MSEQGNGPNGGDGGMEADAPRVQVIGQYIKDLSFENPSAPGNLTARPQIELGVDLQARQLEREHYEVELKLRISAQSEDNKPVFLLELLYAGLFQLHAIPEEVRQQVLLIEAPHILFPFARRIVADIVRDGGMPPLMIEPIDFAALYRAKAMQMQQMRSGGQPEA
ncbi:MAG: protein-export chaperone SecB [Alphaproteobacteria bacterium]|nr:protein-export chaperone SecB [Alphaproteobacteria bacterium]